MISATVKRLNDEQIKDSKVTPFAVGDSVKVHVRIKEGEEASAQKVRELEAIRHERDAGQGREQNLQGRIAELEHQAQGAGQELVKGESTTDASGNKRLADIGLYLKDRINAFFKERNMECNLKYIDPSYMIRSVPANAADNFYCSQLAQHAVHDFSSKVLGIMLIPLANASPPNWPILPLDN
jgi:6-phosphofructokinase